MKVIGLGLMSSVVVAVIALSSSRSSYSMSGFDYADTASVDEEVVVAEDLLAAGIPVLSDSVEMEESAEREYDYGDTLEVSDEEENLFDDQDSGLSFQITDKSGVNLIFKINPDGRSVTLIKGDARGARTLTIPGFVEHSGSKFSVSKIESFAFASYNVSNFSPMRGVKRLVIPEGVRSTGQSAFMLAPDLEQVELPSTLEVISYCMFEKCQKLKEVKIPDNSAITRIKSFAFSECTSLKHFKIPKNVNEIEEGPWRGCVSLRNLTIAMANQFYEVYDGVLYNNWKGELIQYPAGKKDRDYQVLTGTKVICNSAFYETTYLKEVSLPASISMISHIAFFGCASLKDVTFHNDIPFIGNEAFANCPELHEITLYGSPEYTNNPGDIYNTFSDRTQVKIFKHYPISHCSKALNINPSAWKTLVPGLSDEQKERN